MSNSNFLGVAVVSTDLVRNTLRSPDFIVSVVETHGASIQILNVGGGIEGSMIISESWEDSGFKAQLKVNRGTSLTTFGIGAKEGSTCMTRGPKDDSVFDIDIETQVGIGPMAMAHAEKSREVSICALHGASVGVTDSLVLSVKLVPRTLTKALQDLQEWGLNSYNESLRAIGYPGQASAPSRGSLEAPGPDKKPGDGGGKGGGGKGGGGKGGGGKGGNL